MNYVFFVLSVVLVVLLISKILGFARKKAPTGPDASTWSLNIFLTLILAVILICSFLLFYFHKEKWALLILFSPFLLMVITFLQSGTVGLYAALPSFRPTIPLKLLIKNPYPKPLHVKIDCLFRTISRSTESVYDTFHYYTEPNSTKTFELPLLQTRLLSKKASSVSIFIYERDMLMSGSTPVLVDNDRNQIYVKETPEAFRHGEYMIDVAALREKKTILSSVPFLQ